MAQPLKDRSLGTQVTIESGTLFEIYRGEKTRKKLSIIPRGDPYNDGGCCRGKMADVCYPPDNMGKWE